jgi:hypothetical protein
MQKNPLRLVNVCWTGAPEWFDNGKPVSVQIGRGEHAGSLRIAKGGSTVVLPRKTTSKGTTRVLIRAWPSVPGPTPPIHCQHTIDGDAVIITLPWAAQLKPGLSPAAQLQSVTQPERPTAPTAAPAPKPMLATPAAAKPVIDGIIATSGAPVVTTKSTILHWGWDRGIGVGSTELDLSAINAKRRALGLKLFEVEETGRGSSNG